jgi:ATP-dependent RNA helicase DeaD
MVSGEFFAPSCAFLIAWFIPVSCCFIYIGSIQIFDDCSTIDLPDEMPNEVLKMLQKTVVCGKRLNMTELTEKNNKATTSGNRPSNKKRTTGRKKFSRNHKRDNEKSNRRGKKPKFSR